MPLLAPIPDDEMARLAEVRALSALSDGPDPRFDRISRIAALLFEVPVSMVAWMDEQTQYIKSVQGIELSQAPRDISFCGHTIYAEEALVVADTHNDPRFSDNPWVVNQPNVRFYAGYPVRGPQSGQIVGTVCLYDLQPRVFSEDDVHALRDLAAMVEQSLAADWSVQLNVALQRKAEELTEHFERTQDYAYWSRGSGEVVYINGALMACLGYPVGSPPSNEGEFIAGSIQHPPGATHVLVTRHGRQVWARGEGTPGRFGNTEVMRWTLRNVDDEVEVQHQLIRQAETDVLTSLPNRRGLMRRLDEILAGGGTMSLAMIDMDKLKEINDRMGHEAGDRAIRAMATCLKQSLRATDVVGRLGGDEFLAILPGASVGPARARLERFHKMFAGVGRVGEIQASASIGLVEVSGGDAASALRAADEKLYEAKEGGRNQTVG